LTSATFPS